MNTAQAKQIPLESILANLGHVAVRNDGKELWFNSPFRSEKEPSFTVKPAKNVWYDHGAGLGGNIIDLVMQLYQITSISEVLQEIERITGGQARAIIPSPYKAAPVEKVDDMKITKVCDLENPSLIKYVEKRCIPYPIAKQHVREMYYERAGKQYYALAFPNKSGGYELRNAYYKGSTSPKDVTVIPGQTADRSTVAIFEGFFDFLSGLAYASAPITQPCLVLNSTALKEKAVKILQDSQAKTLHLYLDRDDNGQSLFQYFKEELPAFEIVDKSDLYTGHNDFNDFLIASKSQPTFSF